MSCIKWWSPVTVYTTVHYLSIHLFMSILIELTYWINECILSDFQSDSFYRQDNKSVTHLQINKKMRTPITLRRTRLLRICIIAAIVVPILYLTLTWSDEKGKSIHSQLFSPRSPREAPKLISGKFIEPFPMCTFHLNVMPVQLMKSED